MHYLTLLIKMAWIGSIVVCWMLTLSIASAAVSSIRWCTISSHEETKCVAMKEAFKNVNLKTLDCVAGDSVQHCMELIDTNKADLITLDGGDIYEAGKKFNMIPIMQEVYADDDKGYYAVAVAHKDSGITLNNLEGKKSCHTGVKKTAGWNVPIGYLLEKDLINPTDCQDDIRAAGLFFNASCAPGALSDRYNPYGDNPSSLCDLCSKQDPTDRCPRSSEEPYYNYDGAFRCLVEGGGDVAFIKPVTVSQNTDGQSTGQWAENLRSADFVLLCQDGTTAPIGSEENCHLAFVPSHAVMASKNFEDSVLQDFRSVLKQAQEKFGDDVNSNGFSMFASGDPYGGTDLLFKDSTQSLLEVNQEYDKYLGDAYLKTLQGLEKCPAGSVRWCVISSQEKLKCRAMRDAFTGASLAPALSCFESSSADACARDITDDEADLVALDGGELFRNGRLHNVVPIMYEDYGSGDATYFAVVVVKRGTTFNINDLKGKKSCHTGYGRTVGWNVPIGFLINRGDITIDDKCQIPKAVGGFFSESCVPSVLEPVNNPYNYNPQNLCAICGSTGSDKCKRSDIYSSYDGAFRCLAEGAGDVAFVKHTTVDSNTGGTNTASWARNLRKEDFQLLCPNGSRAEVDNWKSCNLAKAPPHTIVTSEDKTSAERRQMVDLLTQGQDRFKSDTGSGFKMFDSEGYGEDGRSLLFGDSTLELVATTSDTDTYDTFISKEYQADLNAIHCDPQPDSSAVILPSFLLILASLGVQRLLNRG